MIRSLYTGGTGMRAMQFNVDIIGNNLANVNTNGFKRRRPDFQDLFYEQLKTPGAPSTNGTEHPTGLSVGTGVRSASTHRLHIQGNAKKTENPMDVMIQGNGFFQVTRPDGTTAYTRDGSFKLDGNGNIVTANGNFLQPQITVPQNATGITIRSDGTVSADIQGQTQAQQIGQIQLAKFVNPAGLEAEGKNLLSETAASGAPTIATPGQNGVGTLQQGFLEKSNVDVVESLTNMIAAQRAFEFNHRTIRTSDQMLRRAATLLQ
ncbi:MAG: flagellar basal-body rod protein FlgG [bacterium]